MSLDTDFAFSPFTLPSLMDGPQSTPTRGPSRQSRRVSRRSSRHLDSNSGSRLFEDNAESKNGEDGESMSPLDPRRLSPNLHATLVSEILNLRQEVQSKNKEMLNMEESLSSARDDNMKLSNLVADHEREEKSLKRQMQMLEGGTMSALDEMAKDRENALDHVAELKKRLEVSQTKNKKQVDEEDRTNLLWERDQEKWDLEKRTLERKIHIVEGRLKNVLKEVEETQLHVQPKRGAEGLERSHSRASRASGTRSAASMRRDSSVSTDGGTVRNRLSHISEIGKGDHTGTLADELAFDDDDYELDSDPNLEPMSPEALPEEHVEARKARPFSVQSHRQSAKAFKVLGIAVDERSSDEAAENSGRDLGDNDEVKDVASHSNNKQRLWLSYEDSGTQYSPPGTPTFSGTAMPHILEPITEASSLFTLDNSTQEQVFEDARTFADDRSPHVSAQHEKVPMVSSAVQTVEPPLSPPDTPTESKKSALAGVGSSKVAMSTVGTQTEDAVPPSLSAGHRNDASVITDIPLIAIRPASSHSTQGTVVLPPHTKSAACQASIAVPMRSMSMQTEGIRIDNRTVQLPPHLLPSAISSKPSSPAPGQTRRAIATPEDTDDEAKTQATSTSKRASKRLSRDSNRDSIATKSKSSKLSVVDRIDGYVSDDSFITREPMKKTLSRVHDSWKLISDTEERADDQSGPAGTAVVFGSSRHLPSSEGGARTKKAEASHKGNKAGKVLEINTGKAQDMRRTALVASGSAAHVQQRSRSPSLPTLPSSDGQRVEPPFPVPDRSSSRKFPWEGSDGMGSPSPQTVSFFGHEQESRKHKRPPVKKLGLRKSRSQTAEMYSHRRSGSRSPPPPTSGSSFAELESPGISVPPLPNDDISSPFRLPQKPGHKGPTRSVANSAAGSAATSESVHVVDAIAQTMIGEWMWKYVRRRKSFGLQGGDDFDARGRDADAMRHQRWVWLSPCERAVLWSSKQPVSSSALQGKLGQRKLEIQSVLDVRDDNPMPKGADFSHCFGRSILILTPQRALKFTAMSRERHYLWLSALSFLSQPGVVPAELGGIPPVPSRAEWMASPAPPPSRGNAERNNKKLAAAAAAEQAKSGTSSTAILRRHPIRDSIRVAKGKARPVLSAGGRRAHSSPNTAATLSQQSSQQHFDDALEEQEGEDGTAVEGCEAPHVPRTAAHTRKRSNTGPRQTSSSFRSFASKQAAAAVAAAAQHASSPHASMASSSTRWRSHDGEAAADAASSGTGAASRFSSFHTNPRSAASSSVHGASAAPWDDAGAVPPVPPLGSAASSLSAATSARMLNDPSAGTMRMEAFIKDTLMTGGGGGGGGGMAKMPPRSGNRYPPLSGMPREPQSAPLLAAGHRTWTKNRVSPTSLQDPFAGF